MADAKYPPPFSLRLTFEERAKLDKAAAGMPVGAYIRDRLFADDLQHRRPQRKVPVKDHEALGRLLGMLGQARLASNLNQLARAVNSGSLPVTPETEAALQNACADIRLIRAELMRALGLTPEPKP